MRLTILLLLALVNTSCSHQSVNGIFDEQKSENLVFAATIPGWMANTAIRLALKNSEEKELIQGLGVKIKKVRILVAQSNTHHIKSTHTMYNLPPSYELITAIKTGEENIQVWSKDKNDTLEELFLSVQTDENIVLFQLKGKINLDALAKILKGAHNKDEQPKVFRKLNRA